MNEPKSNFADYLELWLLSELFCSWKWVARCFQLAKAFELKHCQRHNGPEGWVLLTKVTSLGHITNSYANLQKFHLQNLDQEATQKSQPSQV